MTRLSARIVLFLIALGSVAGCNGRAMSQNSGTSEASSFPEEASLETLAPNALWNKHLRLSLPVEFNPDGLRIGSSVALLVENLSGEDIWFPSGYGPAIFVYSEIEEEWLEVGDFMQHESPKEEVLHPRGEAPWASVMDFLPELPSDAGATEVRVVVVGHIYRNGQPTNERVAAYLDITLRP